MSKLGGGALRALPALALLMACQGQLTGPDGATPGVEPAANSGGSSSAPPVDLPRPTVGTFAGPIVSAPPATTRFMRLNHSGALSTREQVVGELKRLLATPGASESLLDFHDQLLVMRGYDNISKRDTFLGFGEGVAEDLRQEAKHFIRDVVFQQDHGFTTLMTAPYTFANATRT